MSNHWVPSRYTFSAKLLDKGRILYNSYTGAISLASPEEEEKVQFILAAGIDHDGRCDLAKDMCESGFLVPSGTKEFERAEELHQALKAEKSSHLVLLTTEACNFRCSYCYQTFAQGMMTEETIQGLKAHVAQSVQHLEHLSISWFGGEPLLAYESIIELSDSFLKSCAENHVSYSADMSTNGYFLTKERCKELLKRNVRRYMITLDGVGEVHDRRRTLVGGSGTYEKIIHQLKEIQELDDSFVIDLRVNFDEENVEDIPELLRTLADLFGDDPRFQLLLRPVGRWGGTKDQHIPVCDRTASDKHLWSLTECGVQQG
ncbi:radical SAM protein [Caldalkalibacillus mannanilyticus]|uniref:radical SAM protein n=1 Tax=Caldalkalibacillus mannanilyticus TaxID=1418 RepID=UPI000ADB9A5C